jgi:oxalate decarboxylase/phosphoglucose isomerase-like protein (cupin superfamily)
MKKIKIQDLKQGMVAGIEIQLPFEADTYREDYFEWTASSLTAGFRTKEISGGILQAWHHVPVFREVETHVDAEMFYFIKGTAIMLFADMTDGEPDMDSVQILRILPGSQILVPAGKGHFVAVAEDSEPVYAVIVSPKMDAPRKPLPEPVQGV